MNISKVEVEGMVNQIEKAVAFWNWFKEHAQKYIAFHQIEVGAKMELIDQFSEKIREYHPCISFRMGGAKDAEITEIILSANGQKLYFDAVYILGSVAPEFDGIKVITFAPPVGTKFKFFYRGHEFNSTKTVFFPVVSPEKSNFVGLDVCHKDYTEEEHEMFIAATWKMLQGLLGEKSAAMDIDYMKVSKKPKKKDRSNALPFTEIGAYIDVKKDRV